MYYYIKQDYEIQRNIYTTFILYSYLEKINFTQLAHYGNRCKQCYGQTISKKFDRVLYNINLIKKVFCIYNGYTINPSYIYGKHTPNIGYNRYNIA